MSEHVESVNSVIEKLRAWAAAHRVSNREANAERFETLADELSGVPDELLRLYGLTSSLPADLGNVHDLPPELLEELSVAKADELEDQLATVIRAYGDEASLDQILVGLWRKFKVSQKRRFIQNKLYRMDTVWSVSGRKGVYTTTEPDADEVLRQEVEDRLLKPLRTVSPPDDEDSEVPF